MFSEIPMNIFWLVIAIILGIIEVATVGLMTVWFAIGALAAMVTAMLGFSLYVQLVVFVVISGVLLYFTKPLVKKFMTVKTEKTNADRLIGQKAMVTEEISNIESKGQVKVGGLIWSAKSLDDAAIEKGTIVEVLEIKGVNLIVKKI